MTGLEPNSGNSGNAESEHNSGVGDPHPAMAPKMSPESSRRPVLEAFLTAGRFPDFGGLSAFPLAPAGVVDVSGNAEKTQKTKSRRTTMASLAEVIDVSGNPEKTQSRRTTMTSREPNSGNSGNSEKTEGEREGRRTTMTPLAQVIDVSGNAEKTQGRRTTMTSREPNSGNSGNADKIIVVPARAEDDDDASRASHRC